MFMTLVASAIPPTLFAWHGHQSLASITRDRGLWAMKLRRYTVMAFLGWSSE